jgi:NAD(P)H-hydrate repair Nnr-like enzyme with NAD(P)H-hydrate dehydratase domain
MPTDAMASLRGDVPREIVFESLFTKARDSHHTPASGDTVEAERLRTYLAKGRVNAVVVGPGCMASPLTRESMLVLQEFSAQGGGVLIDAGACHGIVPLASQVGCLSPDRWVLTPHPGEWVKMGLDRAATPETPQGVAEVYTMAKTLGLTLLYKNATPILISGSVKDAPSGSIALFGTRSLARAGSGDVLAGVTAAHLARGMAAEPATLRSQALIGHAADMAARELGEHAVLAQDIIVRLGRN